MPSRFRAMVCDGLFMSAPCQALAREPDGKTGFLAQSSVLGKTGVARCYRRKCLTAIGLATRDDRSFTQEPIRSRSTALSWPGEAPPRNLLPRTISGAPAEQT